MRKATDFDDVAALEPVRPHVAIRSGSSPTVFLRREPAGNDADGADAVISEDEVERWARHASASNGFGDAPISGASSFAQLTSYELYHAARADRSFALGEILITMIQASAAWARRAVTRHG
jgi:hypothetical protein